LKARALAGLGKDVSNIDTSVRMTALNQGTRSVGVCNEHATLVVSRIEKKGAYGREIKNHWTEEKESRKGVSPKLGIFSRQEIPGCLIALWTLDATAKPWA